MWIAIGILAFVVLVEGIFLYQAWSYCNRLHKYLDCNSPNGAIKQMQVKFDAISTALNTPGALPVQPPIQFGGVPPTPDPNFP